MIDIRKFDRGPPDHGWLDARHHFSFANYHDPSGMGWAGSACGMMTISAASPVSAAPARNGISLRRTGAITHRIDGHKGRTRWRREGDALTA